MADQEGMVGDDGEGVGNPVETGETEERDPLRGYVGWVYEELFEELYNQPYQPAKPEPEDPGGEGAGDEEGGGPSDAEGGDAEGTLEGGDETMLAAPETAFDELDLSEEDNAITMIQEHLDAEKNRISRVQEYLNRQQTSAKQKDREEAEFLLNRWGLTIREQIPIPESKLRGQLDAEALEAENLLVPDKIMLDMERRIAIETGVKLKHQNLLSVSKPEEPNYFKATGCLQNRLEARKIKPRLTEEARQALSEMLAERKKRRPPMPPMLNAEERNRNREILRRMETKVRFLKNPRFTADRKAAEKGEVCPFWITPQQVVFRNYEVGSVYEIRVEFRNTTRVGRRLRVLPSNSEVFSTTVLIYEGDAKRPPGADPSSVVAPGMAAFLTVRFAPTSLNDQDEALTVCTELGDYPLPVMARRVQPQLDFEEPVNCGCILAGQTTSVTVPLTNRGGEGSFRFITEGDGGQTGARYETDEEGGTTFICGSFSIKPAQFYLEGDKSVDITVHFSAPQVGQHKQPVLVEGDNGERTHITLIAITDALRLEMLRWPTLPSTVAPRPAPPGTSPWSLVPWQLRWLKPGVQVGCSESQTMTLSNGGYLPITVHWKFARPPKNFLTKLAVGGMPRLTDSLIQNITHWETYADSSLGSAKCPFKVSPLSVRIEPFEEANFTFTFSPSAPVGTHSTAFSYLVAEDLPASGHCLLPYERLVGLQASMQPEEYQKGLPLFGNQLFQPKAAHRPSNKEITPDLAHCVTTSVVLQGVCTAPKLSLMPPLLAFCGDTTPFISHTREVVIRNTGVMPARFRVRLSSNTQPSGADHYPPLYITSEQEVGACPIDTRDKPIPSNDPKEQLQNWAEWLGGQWPPLPPEPPTEAHADGSPVVAVPGVGALATVVCRPSSGIMKPGETIHMKVTMRAVRECDIDAQLLVDLPTNEGDPHPCDTPPLKIRILSAVRSPRPEMSNTSLLDFGVVRAHARHPMTIHVRNPSSIPTLVRLEHHSETPYHEEDDEEVDIRQHAITPVGEIDENPDAPAHVPADLTARSSKSSAGTASPRGGVGAAATVGNNLFPFASHKEVVAHLISEINRDVDALANPVIDPQDDDDLDLEPWVHARSGCLDRSGRKPYRGRMGAAEIAEEDDDVGEEDDEELDPDVMFVFRPGWVLVPPKSTMPVEVTLRAKGVEKYETFIRIMGFDSLASQCVEVIAEVQLPLARLSETSIYYPVTYVKTASDPRTLKLINDSDMPAPFRWKIPPGLGAGLEVQMDHLEGVISPRSEKEIALTLFPTMSTAGRAEVECYAYIGAIIQPLTLRVSARVFGLQVDYAVVQPTESEPDVTKILEPDIIYEPRTEGEEEDDGRLTWAVEGMHPSKHAPPVDFGKMMLQDTKTLRLILYNRSGIATPFSAKMMRYPAFDPASKGKKLGKLLGSATRMAATTGSEEETNGHSQEPEKQIHSNEPKQVAASSKGFGKNKDGTKGGPRKFLLDDKHEKQAFRSTTGAEFAKQKELREQGAVALNYGRGYAVKLVPSNGWLHPFGKAEILCTSYSDLPGAMLDDMLLTIKNMNAPDFHLPVRLNSHGNPLYLPDQQVALSQHYNPPRLSCGTIVPVEHKATRRFKVGNNSATNIHVSWRVFPQRQVENTAGERQFVNIALCNKPERELDELEEKDEEEEESETVEDDFEFMMWANEPPEIHDPFSLPSGDPPVKIEPMNAVLPKHGTATFTVTMNASKTTTTAAGHYHYKLVGKGRYAREKGDEELGDGRRGSKGSKDSKRGSKERSSLIAQETASLVQLPVSPLNVEDEVAMLPEIELELDELDENDSDLEEMEMALAPSQAPSKGEDQAQDSSSRRGSRRPSKEASKAPSKSPTQGLEDAPLTILSDEPDQDVVSTLVIDTLGDCILPRLTVDKKPDPSQKEDIRHEDEDGEAEAQYCPVFKFEHSAIAASIPDDQLPIGTVVTGGGLDSPAPGVTLCLVRQITLSNEHACNVSCRFRIDKEAPFRIRQISQVGKTTVRPTVDKKGVKARFLENPFPELFTLGWKQTISIQVQFIPELVHQSRWKDTSENIFHGNLYVEYPRESVVENPDTIVKPDVQRIHLKGTSRRPSVMISVIPMPEIDPKELKRANQPEWGPPPPDIVEFGYVHVESGIARHRTVLLSNETNVLANWKLLHVGRKKKTVTDIGMTCNELEELGALDDPSAFSFDVVGGFIEGPTKVARTWDQIDRELNTKKLAEQTAGKEGGGRRKKGADAVRPSDKRTPSWYPSTSALPHAIPHRDEEKYMPARVTITFQPKKNELYKCRFRLQVDGGRNVDFICRGCGSYDEDDDVMELYES